MPELFMDVRAVTESRREIVGMVAPYDQTSYLVGDPRGERLKRGCFARSIKARAARVPLFVNHDHAIRFGTSTGWEETADGLVGTFRVNEGDRGDDLLAHVRAGYYPAMSVGFRPTDRAPGSDGVVEVTAAALEEVSVVGMAAYPDAAVMAVRSPAIGPDPVLWAREDNRPRVDLTPIRPVWLP